VLPKGGHPLEAMIGAAVIIALVYPHMNLIGSVPLVSTDGSLQAR
jgi:gamma-glutamyltranspeptidase